MENKTKAHSIWILLCIFIVLIVLGTPRKTLKLENLKSNLSETKLKLIDFKDLRSTHTTQNPGYIKMEFPKEVAGKAVSEIYYFRTRGKKR